MSFVLRPLFHRDHLALLRVESHNREDLKQEYGVEKNRFARLIIHQYKLWFELHFEIKARTYGFEVIEFKSFSSASVTEDLP